jgi:monoamine oxidase
MRAAIGHVASVYGSEAFHPIDMLERDWPPDEWGGGGYCQFVPGSGAPTQVATLLGGSPGVTFAATELSDTFPGYIEGALHAGRRAAADAVARLDAHLAE